MGSISNGHSIRRTKLRKQEETIASLSNLAFGSLSRDVRVVRSLGDDSTCPSCTSWLSMERGERVVGRAPSMQPKQSFETATEGWLFLPLIAIVDLERVLQSRTSRAFIRTNVRQALGHGFFVSFRRHVLRNNARCLRHTKTTRCPAQSGHEFKLGWIRGLHPPTARREVHVSRTVARETSFEYDKRIVGVKIPSMRVSSVRVLSSSPCILASVSRYEASFPHVARSFPCTTSIRVSVVVDVGPEDFPPFQEKQIHRSADEKTFAPFLECLPLHVDTPTSCT